MNDDVSKLLKYLINFGIVYKYEDDSIFLLQKQSLNDTFGDESQAKKSLEENIGGSILWSDFDNEYLAIDKITIKEETS